MARIVEKILSIFRFEYGDKSTKVSGNDSKGDRPFTPVEHDFGKLLDLHEEIEYFEGYGERTMEPRVTRHKHGYRLSVLTLPAPRLSTGHEQTRGRFATLSTKAKKDVKTGKEAQILEPEVIFDANDYFESIDACLHSDDSEGADKEVAKDGIDPDAHTVEVGKEES